MLGKKRHALIFFLAAVALPCAVFSQSADGLLRAGDEYYRNGDFSKAAESWKRALDADPKNLEVKQKLEKLYSEKRVDDQGQYEKKISDLSLQKKSMLADHTKEVVIDWEAVDGAAKYLVQIKDSSDKMLVNSIVAENRIRFPVSPGNYRMRVGAYNIFEKIGAWSDWTELKVVAAESLEAHPFPGAISHGCMFTAGYLYSFVVSDFRDLYESSSNGWILRFGYQMKQMHIVESIPVLRNMHLECEIARRSYINRDSITNYDMTLDVFSVHLNAAYISDFSFPVNFALRMGGGAAYSRQSIKMNDPSLSVGTPTNITTNDPCYQFSVSALIDVSPSLFIEVGTGIFWIDYLETDLKSVSLFCLAGIHI